MIKDFEPSLVFFIWNKLNVGCGYLPPQFSTRAAPTTWAKATMMKISLKAILAVSLHWHSKTEWLITAILFTLK